MATNNTHKTAEVQHIAPNIELLTPADIGIQFQHDETGTTFQENAVGKAFALYKLLKMNSDAPQVSAVIADDSGICVDALDGRPGIYSARYGADVPGKTVTSDADRNQLLLQELQDTPDEQRTARYVCAIAVIFDEYRFITVQDTLEGRIARAPSQGNGGFGYDPIFLLPGSNRAVADVSAKEKHAISHRGKALRRALSAVQADTIQLE